jgi:hypothetical protein
LSRRTLITHSHHFFLVRIPEMFLSPLYSSNGMLSSRSSWHRSSSFPGRAPSEIDRPASWSLHIRKGCRSRHVRSSSRGRDDVSRWEGPSNLPTVSLQYLLIDREPRFCILFSYDKLVIACGSSTNTHGVPGLEHCFQLKTIRDAQDVRRRIMGEPSIFPRFLYKYVSHVLAQ